MPKREGKIELNRVLGCIQENKDARCNVFPLHFDVYHIV